MRIFFDSSALIKYFIEEPGTEFVQEFILHFSESGNHPFIVSGVTYAEVMTTFRRALHDKRIHDTSFQSLIQAFEEFWNCLSYPQLSEALIKRSGELSLQATLTGADAFQLASALEANTELFICADEQLCKAAFQNHLTVWNPALGNFDESSS